MELIFVCGMKKGPHFLFFIQIHNLANIIYRKNCPFPITLWSTFVINEIFGLNHMCESVSRLLILFYWLLCLSLC